MAGGPPEQLVGGLVDGPSIVSGVDWRDSVGSTNAVAAEAARAGAPEGHVVLTDHQTAGRGRLGRAWREQAGTGLLLSIVLRPAVGIERLTLLPLLVGLSLAEATAPHVAGAGVACKWPNDLLVRRAPGEPWRKAAGVLVEVAGAGPAVVAGVGVNVDWRGVDRPPELYGATSLADVGPPVDRWRLFAAFAGVLSNRYRRFGADPGGFMDDYRQWCATLGRQVEVSRPGDDVLAGVAEDVDGRGALRVRASGGRVHAVAAGDVVHVR